MELNQEEIMKIQMMEQEVNYLNQQLQLIDENIKEMTQISDSLEGISKGNEILSNLGKKIYLPVEVKDDKLVVEVGKGNYVKKSVSETKEILERENNKLMEGKGKIIERLDFLQEEMSKMLMELQKAQIGKKEESIEDLAENK
jgi:prefoldin alpha subunit